MEKEKFQLFKRVNELTAKYPNLSIGEINELKKISAELSQRLQKDDYLPGK